MYAVEKHFKSRWISVFSQIQFIEIFLNILSQNPRLFAVLKPRFETAFVKMRLQKKWENFFLATQIIQITSIFFCWLLCFEAYETAWIGFQMISFYLPYLKVLNCCSAQNCYKSFFCSLHSAEYLGLILLWFALRTDIFSLRNSLRKKGLDLGSGRYVAMAHFGKSFFMRWKWGCFIIRKKCLTSFKKRAGLASVHCKKNCFSQIVQHHFHPIK